MKRSALTPHFKALCLRGVADTSIQTVIPKRLLKKAVDRNLVRRVIRESYRTLGKPSLNQASSEAVRVLLLNTQGFKTQPSRKALKASWHLELVALWHGLK